MDRFDVKIKIISPHFKEPLYATDGSAGCDVYAAREVILGPGKRALVSTGMVLELPRGTECQVRPRSGLAIKEGVTVLNAPGTIDSDYRGEVMVMLINHGNESYTVERGSRIAQLVFARVSQASFSIVDEVSDTDRAAGGFGSTGTK